MSDTTKRIKYGFKLEFPEKPFTVKLLTNRGARPSYITAYKRVQKAISDNLIEVVGEMTPKTKRRGAREKIYARVNAETVMITATPAVVTAAPDNHPF
jgi:hypothetical protein